MARVAVAEGSRRGVFAYPPQWIPETPSLVNYVFALTGTQVPWYLWNSVKVAAAGDGADAGRGHSRGLRAVARAVSPAAAPLMATLLAVQMLSPVVLLLPLYSLVDGSGSIDTHARPDPRLRRHPGAVHGLGAEEFLRRACRRRSSKPRGSTARRGSARSGRSRCRSSRPGSAATTIFNLAAYWSEFALALVLLDSQSRFTIPLGVFSLQSAYETEWQLVAAASFIGLVPMMAAFVFLQRYFIAGLTAGRSRADG